MISNSRKILEINKILIIIFGLLLIIGNCFSQSITWQRTYDGRDHGSDGSFGVCKADGDNIYIAGTTTFLPNRKYIYILKLNPFGDTIWTRAITLGTISGETANAIVSNNDGSCVITGDAGNPYSIKLDLNGNIIWNNMYGSGFKQCYCIIKTSDGGYIACGRDAGCSTDCAYILKIDSVGGLQWQQTYPAGYFKGFYSIVEANDYNGYIAVGFDKANITDTTRGYIVKINYLGGIIWEKRYLIEQNSYINCISNCNSGYLIAGGTVNNSLNVIRLFFGRLNELGDTSNIKIFETSSNEYFAGFNIINDNKFVMASSKDSILALNGHVFTFDSLGTVISSKMYLTEDVMNLRYAFPLTNGDIIFGGSVDFDAVSTRNDIYVLRTDSLLNAPPPIGINHQNVKLPVNFKLYQNFPNPFNPVTNIKYDVPSDVNVSIRIYDILGKEVFNTNEYKIAGSYEVQFDGNDHASGMYYYQITVRQAGSSTVEYIDTKKMVLIK
ncbi:MAG: T9SS type A sorting domain-containing protein [Ignavibacteria bacterium]